MVNTADIVVIPWALRQAPAGAVFHASTVPYPGVAGI